MNCIARFFVRICPYSWDARVVPTNKLGMWPPRPWCWVYGPSDVTVTPFPLPRLPLGSLRSPIFSFPFFPQCVAWSQAITVITWMHMQVMQQSLLPSVIQVRFRNTSTVLNGRLFDSPCRPGIYLPQKKESRAWSQLSAGQAYGKIRVLAKSRKRFNFKVYSGFTS